MESHRFLLKHSANFRRHTIPGSKKGLEYIFDRPINEKNYQYHMEALMAALPDDIRAMKLHAQDLQNCLCEFSKYWRYIHKVPGRKRIYHGTSTMGGA